MLFTDNIPTNSPVFQKAYEAWARNAASGNFQKPFNYGPKTGQQQQDAARASARGEEIVYGRNGSPVRYLSSSEVDAYKGAELARSGVSPTYQGGAMAEQSGRDVESYNRAKSNMNMFGGVVADIDRAYRERDEERAWELEKRKRTRDNWAMSDAMRSKFEGLTSAQNSLLNSPDKFRITGV